MFGNRCHVSVLVFLLCLCNYNVKGGILGEASKTKSPINVVVTHAPLDIISKATEVPLVISSVESSSATSAPAKGKPEKNDPITVSPDVTPSTVSEDPDNPTPTTTAEPTPTTKPSTTVSTTPTTVTPPTPTTKTPPTTPSTETPPTTSVSPTPPSTPLTKPTSTTEKPATTTASVPHHNRQFDGPSFIGGIVLASGLMAIGFVAFKFYKARTERNYHTL